MIEAANLLEYTELLNTKTDIRYIILNLNIKIVWLNQEGTEYEH